MANEQLMADRMFQQPQQLVLKPRATSAVDENSVVIGVELNGEAKAWPIRYILYHHQVQDTIGGKQILVTYCNVCRTGRVFEPLVGGQHETFRLVGMDQFNAMFEDTRTGSWWRQATGVAVTGPMKGTRLNEVTSDAADTPSVFRAASERARHAARSRIHRSLRSGRTLRARREPRRPHPPRRRIVAGQVVGHRRRTRRHQARPTTGTS